MYLHNLPQNCLEIIYDDISVHKKVNTYMTGDIYHMIILKFLCGSVGLSRCKEKVKTYTNYRQLIFCISEYNTVQDIIEAVKNDEIDFLLLDRFIINAHLEEFSQYRFRVTKLIDKSYSYFVFVKSSEKNFTRHWNDCFQNLKYGVDKTIRVTKDIF